MNDDVVLSIQQMVGSWRTLCAESSSRTLASGDGIEYLFSGIPIAFFNIALLTQHNVSGEALKSYGHDACVWASSKGVPWFFILTNETVEAGIDAVAILDGCGLAPNRTLIWCHEGCCLEAAVFDNLPLSDASPDAAGFTCNLPVLVY